MKRQTTLVLILALALTGACNRDRAETASSEPATAQQQPAASAALSPEELGQLGAEIRKDPARAEEILARRGLNSQSFEKQIRDVTENPEASKRYAEAYRKGSA